MKIIRCKCGHYKLHDDNICMVCGCDCQNDDEYSIPDNQDVLIELWNDLGGEYEFNQHMKQLENPQASKNDFSNYKEHISIGDRIKTILKWGFIILFVINFIWMLLYGWIYNLFIAK